MFAIAQRFGKQLFRPIGLSGAFEKVDHRGQCIDDLIVVVGFPGRRDRLLEQLVGLVLLAGLDQDLGQPRQIAGRARKLPSPRL